MRRDRHDGDIRPLTFGQALAAHVRIITWCKQRERSSEPEVAELHGEETTVIRLGKAAPVLPMRGDVTFVISGAPR